jgi:hypothetical protein
MEDKKKGGLLPNLAVRQSSPTIQLFIVKDEAFLTPG